MIHNYKQDFFLFFFLLLGVSCNSFSNPGSASGNFSGSFVGEYYQKAKISNSNNFFEKSSSHYRFLVVSPGKEKSLQVKEIDISFYAYTNRFIEEVNYLFPDKSPSKFTIYEKIKHGEGKQINENSDLEVQYTNFTLRQTQSSDLLGGLDKFLNRKTEAQELFNERITYSITPDEGVWRFEEVQVKEGQENIRWKNYQGGTPTRNYPYTEFFPNKNTLEYSRIYSFEDFSYKKIFKDIPAGSKLYSNKDFVVYYYPSEIFDPNEQSFIKNKQLTLYKKDLPIIIYKKKESTLE